MSIYFNENSLSKPGERLQFLDKKLKDTWAKEAKDRIEAYNRGLISIVNEDDIF